MSIISSLDFLGTKPNMFIRGKTSNKTVLGGILSIGVTISLILGVFYFMSLLISRETFTVLQSDEYQPEAFADWNLQEISIS